METREAVTLAIIAAIAAAAAFALLAPKSATHDIDGLKVVVEPSGQAFEALSTALAPEKIKIEERLLAGNRTENTAVIIASTEVIAGLASCRATPFYAVMNDGSTANCEAANGCAGAIVTVLTGSCDCLKVNRTSITIEGSQEWLRASAPLFRKLFGFSVKDSCVPQPLPLPLPATPARTPSINASTANAS